MKVEKKYKCGYVAGMFDIFHIGHLDMLRLSKELCEHLIVAIVSDEFYRQRKKREPIMPYNESREIIEAIRYVDEVVMETNLDKLGEYDKYHFNVMFASEDHEFEDVYIKATEELKQLGVDTIYMKRRGVSSTLLRKYLE
jgi:glycerol-3-phosphate cytidylyltransferase